MRRRDMLVGFVASVPLSLQTSDAGQSLNASIIERDLPTNENCSFLIGIREDLRSALRVKQNTAAEYTIVTCPLCKRKAKVGLRETTMLGDAPASA